MNDTKKKVLNLAVCLTALLFVGCSSGYDTEVEGLPNGGVDELCIHGVVYYSGMRRLAVGFNADSTVKTCNT
jgi:hypothetical protein